MVVIFPQLRPDWSLSPRIQMKQAEILGGGKKGNQVYLARIVERTASKSKTTLPQRSRAPNQSGSFFSSPQSLLDFYLMPSCSWRWRLARDRHMCVCGGGKVTWISRKRKAAKEKPQNPPKVHWRCFSASSEHEFKRVSTLLERETMAQIIYWRSRYEHGKKLLSASLAWRLSPSWAPNLIVRTVLIGTNKIMISPKMMIIHTSRARAKAASIISVWKERWERQGSCRIVTRFCRRFERSVGQRFLGIFWACCKEIEGGVARRCWTLSKQAAVGITNAQSGAIVLCISFMQAMLFFFSVSVWCS